MKKVMYLMLCLIAGINIVMAQNRQITGTVFSAEDNEPIIGASVVVKGKQNGTVTDIDGNYTLFVSPNATTSVVSYLGLKPQEVAIKNGQRIVLEIGRAHV